MYKTQLSDKIYDLFCDYDSTWIKRKRSMTTSTIFNTLTESAITKTGVEAVLQSKDLTNAAFCKARQKLPLDAFQGLHRKLIDNELDSSRIFAIDGSKFYVPSGFRAFGFKSRTNDKDVPRKAKRPIAMLSSVIDVYTNVCYDFIVSKHFNERLSVYNHMPRFCAGDVLIFDRGYFSADLYKTLCDQKIDSVFRLKLDTIALQILSRNVLSSLQGSTLCLLTM
jgi:hypothetical protein